MSDEKRPGLGMSWVMSIGDLAPGESITVSLNDPAWRVEVHADPNPMPRFRLFGRRR